MSDIIYANNHGVVAEITPSFGYNADTGLTARGHGICVEVPGGWYYLYARSDAIEDVKALLADVDMAQVKERFEYMPDVDASEAEADYSNEDAAERNAIARAWS